MYIACIIWAQSPPKFHIFIDTRRKLTLLIAFWIPHFLVLAEKNEIVKYSKIIFVIRVVAVGETQAK